MLGFFLYTRISARKKLLYTGLYYKHHPLVRQTLELSTPSPHACCHCSVHKGNAGALSIAAHRATEQQKDLQEAVTLSNCYPGKTQYSETQITTQSNMQQALVFLVSLLKRKGLLEMFYGIRIWLKIGTASTKHAKHLPPHNISAFFSFSPLWPAVLH